MSDLWEIAEQLRTSDQEGILSSIPHTDPFWIGASYAIDPFVGIICRLPIFNPRAFGSGAPARVFERIVKGILDQSLSGESLVRAIETFSKYCTEAEWTRWYRPILQGDMDIRVPLALFNKYCPDELRIPPPRTSAPRPIQSMKDLPKRFFLQPLYAEERVFWMVDSKNPPHEIMGYDKEARRYRNARTESMLKAFASTKAVDIVLFGYATKDLFISDDMVSHDQFTQETGAYPLYRRLEALAALGLPPVQMSDVLTPAQPELFLKEFNLILQQGYKGVIVRDMDAHYPFRTQPDILIHPTVKAIATVTSVVPGFGVRFEYTRAKKLYEGLVHLGLTKEDMGDISELPGRRFELVSCGTKDGELLLPVFLKWSIEK